MELGNSSSGTGPLTINQIISLGAGMGAFSVLLVLLGFMVAIFWYVESERLLATSACRHVRTLFVIVIKRHR